MKDQKTVERPPERDEIVAWGAGCAIGGAATLGILILVFLLFLAIEPPTWVQVAIGTALAAGGAVLSWLIAQSLGRRPPSRSGR